MISCAVNSDLHELLRNAAEGLVCAGTFRSDMDPQNSDRTRDPTSTVYKTAHSLLKMFIHSPGEVKLITFNLS